VYYEVGLRLRVSW